MIIANKLIEGRYQHNPTNNKKGIGNKLLTTIALFKPSSAISRLVKTIRSLYPVLSAFLVIIASIMLREMRMTNKIGAIKSFMFSLFLRCS
jgi:hypothetical protein